MVCKNCKKPIIEWEDELMGIKYKYSHEREGHEPYLYCTPEPFDGDFRKAEPTTFRDYFLLLGPPDVQTPQ